MKVVKGLGCVCVLCVYVCVATTRVKSLTEGWILLGVQLPLCQVCFVDESSEGVGGGGGGGGYVCVATTRVKSLTGEWILLRVQLPLCQVCFVDEGGEGVWCVCVCVRCRMCVYVCVCVWTTPVKSLIEGWILLGVQLPLCQVCLLMEMVKGCVCVCVCVCVCGDYSCEVTNRGVDSFRSAATTVSGVFC